MTRHDHPPTDRYPAERRTPGGCAYHTDQPTPAQWVAVGEGAALERRCLDGAAGYRWIDRGAAERPS